MGNNKRLIDVLTDVGNIKIVNDKRIYMPSDDSFLIIKAMLILKNKGYSFNRIIDIGTGSGILSIAAQRIFDPKVLVSIDISPYAVVNAKKAIEKEGVRNLVIRCDGTSCLRRKYDLSIVNPPYLPSNDKIKKGSWIVKTWQEGRNHKKLCLSSTISENILILKSSLSKFNQDKCLKKFNYNKIELVKTNAFMERLEVNFWENLK